MERKRLTYLDLTKGLGILMVTYGHILPLSDPVDTWMNLFKLSLFYITAGYLMGLRPDSLKLSVPQFVQKLLKSLGWPYLTFSLVSMPVRWWFKLLKGGNLLDVVKLDLFNTVTLQGISVLWFLPSLFFAEVIFYAIQKSRSKLLIGLWFVLPILFALPAHRWYKASGLAVQVLLIVLGKGIIASWFVQVGFYSPRVLKRLPNPGEAPWRLVLGIVLSGLTVAMVPFTAKINFNMLNLGTRPVLFFLGSLTGSFGALLFFQAVEGKLPLSGALTYCGTNSLVMMATQRGLRIVNIATGGVREIAQLHDVVCPAYYAETLSILLVVLLMEYAVIELINRYAPFLARYPGKRRRSA